ncbi:MAG: glycosyltransferase family 2 protein [Candidatus Dormibacteraeota bacterium]|nr:glycosyltransferase family 2 protein [Candidatus Dormibacteraeota bacterium]MBV9526303.1 glycosyltransferase family 2 protein [Candidatus Dormibacteraeota bacterium]
MTALSVVVPAYNEEDRLPASLEAMRPYLDSLGEDYELLVVDDGSTDRTVAVTREAGECWPQLRVIPQGRNLGKGGAVRTGMLAATGRLRLFSDADLSTPIEELGRLREQITGSCHVAIASRALPESVIEEHQPGRREMIGRTYNRLLRVLALPGLSDTQCGFKLFTAEAAVACFEPLKTLRFGFDAEVLLRARRNGWTVAEVPVRWRHREDSRVSPMRDSARTLYELVTLRINARR